MIRDELYIRGVVCSKMEVGGQGDRKRFSRGRSAADGTASGRPTPAPVEKSLGVLSGKVAVAAWGLVRGVYPCTPFDMEPSRLGKETRKGQGNAKLQSHGGPVATRTLPGRLALQPSRAVAIAGGQGDRKSPGRPASARRKLRPRLPPLLSPGVERRNDLMIRDELYIRGCLCLLEKFKVPVHGAGGGAGARRNGKSGPPCKKNPQQPKNYVRFSNEGGEAIINACADDRDGAAGAIIRACTLAPSRPERRNDLMIRDELYI